MGQKDQQRQAPAFVLARDAVGWRSSESMDHTADLRDKVEVVRGSLLSPLERSKDLSRAVTATMLVRDIKDVRVTVSMRDLVEVAPVEAELLARTTSQTSSVWSVRTDRPAPAGLPRCL